MNSKRSGSRKSKKLSPDSKSPSPFDLSPRDVKYWTDRGWTFCQGIDESSVLISPGDGDSQMSVSKDGRVLIED